MRVCECVFFREDKCFMHRRYCVPVWRTVLDVPTNTLISSSLAFRCPRGTAKHYFAGVAYLFSSSTFSVFSLFVTGNRCCWSPRLFALLLLFLEYLLNRCGETADCRHFSSVVNINFTRISGSGVYHSVSSSSFLTSVKRWRQKNTYSAFSGTPHLNGHCGASSCLNRWR